MTDMRATDDQHDDGAERQLDLARLADAYIREQIEWRRAREAWDECDTYDFGDEPEEP